MTLLKRLKLGAVFFVKPFSEKHKKFSRREKVPISGLSRGRNFRFDNLGVRNRWTITSRFLSEGDENSLSIGIEWNRYTVFVFYLLFERPVFQRNHPV